MAGGIQEPAARTAVREGKKSVEPKPKENPFSQCQEAVPHPACCDLLLALLGRCSEHQLPQLGVEGSSL